MIVKKGNRFMVKSKSGKNLGSYLSRGEAEDRLRQVHYFKTMEDGGKVDPQGEPDPETMYMNKYNTPLTPEEQVSFNAWVESESQRQGRNILMDRGAYDIQGFWKSGDYKNMDEDNHGSDRWKKPNHPTFSNQSIYNGVDGMYGGTWTDNGGYRPSQHTLGLYDKGYYEWMFNLEPHRPEHLDMSQYEEGANAPINLPAKPIRFI